jgi:ribose transport system ATP-binding protein
LPSVLHMKGISKRFPGVIALDNVDFCCQAGEVHALVGENGAGKTTLMNILGGLYKPDAGTILIDGNPVMLEGPADATTKGIGFIHQELNLLPNLTVCENVFSHERYQGEGAN